MKSKRSVFYFSPKDNHNYVYRIVNLYEADFQVAF